MKKLLLYLTLFIAPTLLWGQDIHFSQNSRTNFLINPAFTGTFSGNIRATMNWKDQWRSINKTYRTYASSAEFSFAKGRARRPTFYAIGIHAAKDVSGDIELGTTTAGFSFSSLFRITRNQRLTVGVQGAIGKTGINPTNMQWGSQYSGLTFDPSLFDGEGIDYLPQNYSDLSAGVGYWYHKNDKNVAFGAPQDARFGIAVFHLNRAENAFGVGETSRIPMRMVIHGSAMFGTSMDDLFWYPNITAEFQGKQHELLFGALMKYTISSGSKMTGFGKNMAFSAGINLRTTNILDAVIPQILIDFRVFSIGLSYDVNVSGLNTASKYRGGFELSIRYTNPDAYTHKNPFRKAVDI